MEKLYPTALHLFEARKFLDDRPDLAECIRQCERVDQVEPLGTELADVRVFSIVSFFSCFPAYLTAFCGRLFLG